MIKVIQGRILVVRTEAAEMTKGGIHIPDPSLHRAQSGTVIQASNEVRPNGVEIQSDVEPGDLVYFTKHAGSDVEINGRKYLIIKYEDLLAVDTGPEAVAA